MVTESRRRHPRCLDSRRESSKFLCMTNEPSDHLRARLQALFSTELIIEQELGRGGMAAVFLAFDPALERRVAIKMLLPEIAGDQDVAERFLREGRTVASLQHPNVVSVYAVRSGRGTNAIVMQFVDGRSLDTVVSAQRLLPLQAAGLILSQVSAGLQHAHERGVIHRDVKPANVLISRDGRAVVSDFGIARRNDGSAATKTGMVLGTWDYMSPEQRSGERVMPATDQYALGVMAFELLTGTLPFTGDLGAVMRAHMLNTPPSLRGLRPEIPLAVEALVLRMLAKAPEDRWPTLNDAQRVLGALTPDTGSTTRQIAAYSKNVPRLDAPVTMRVVTPTPVNTFTPVSMTALVAAFTPSASSIAQPMATPRGPSVAPVAVVAHATTVVKPSSRAGWIVGLVAIIAAVAIGSWWIVSRNSVSSSLPQAPTQAPQTQTQASQRPTQAASPTAVLPRTTSAAPQSTAPTASRVTIGNALLMESPTAPPQDPPSTRTNGDVSVASSPAAVAPSPAAASTPSPPTSAVTAATLADARLIASRFVTSLNQRRVREVTALTAIGGDASLRAELIARCDKAAEFSVGIDRQASTPRDWTNGFETDVSIETVWRNGRKLLRVHLYASRGADGWQLVGIGLEADR